MKRELPDGSIVKMSASDNAERASQLAEHQRTEYKRNRAASYMPIEEQVDLLYWDMKNGTTAFIDHRDSVKAAHPKPVTP